MSIKIRQVSKTFHSRTGHLQVLDAIDLHVSKGEFVCLLGPSGCGKTTLLNLIAGIEPATQGDILISGHSIDPNRQSAIMMFQEATLFPWLSVDDNVSFGLAARGVSKASRRETSERYLELVGLFPFRSSRVHELSGGMKQRVALARALCLQPEILLMDEPFAALDAMSRDSLHEELQRIWKKTGATIVFVTHNVREALILGDRVVVMAPRPGRISEVFPVKLPRPRHFEDPGIAEHARVVLAALRSTAQ